MNSFVVGPKFVETYKVPVEYSQQLESVATAKIMAQRGNPPYTVSGHGEAEAILMADGGAVEAYDLNIVTNYKDIYETAKLPPRQGMDAWWASFQMLVFALAYNTKDAAKPARSRTYSTIGTRAKSEYHPTAGTACTGCTPSTRR